MFSKLRRMYYDHIDRKEYKKYATPEEKAQPNDKQQELRKALLLSLIHISEPTRH